MPDAPLATAADALARRLLQDVPTYQPDAGDRLPGPVAHLLGHQLEARVTRETALPETRWIDAAHPAVREAQSSWREAVQSAARVPAEAWEAFLTETTRLALSHLVQPATTLATVAFADETEPLPTPLVLDRLRAFGPYPYLLEIVERYVDKKGLGHIDHAGLERLLLRIDHRMVAGFSADEWLTLLDPFFDLLDGTASAPLLQMAFEARGQHQLVAGLSGGAVSREDLRAHLIQALSMPPAPAISEPEEAAPVEPPSRTNESVPEMAPPAPAPPTERPDFEVELRPPAPPVIGSKFNAPEDTAPDDSDVLGPARPVEIVEPMAPMASLNTAPEGITDAVITGTTDDIASAESEPLWKRHVGPAPASAPSPPATDTPIWAQFSQETPAVASPTSASAPRAQPALRTEASLNDLELAVFGTSDPDRRAWYTEELFSGDASDYRQTLLQLEAARTWTEATDIIARDVFRKHSVNIYSEPAVTFTDAVEAAMEAR